MIDWEIQIIGLSYVFCIIRQMPLVSTFLNGVKDSTAHNLTCICYILTMTEVKCHAKPKGNNGPIWNHTGPFCFAKQRSAFLSAGCWRCRCCHIPIWVQTVGIRFIISLIWNKLLFCIIVIYFRKILIYFDTNLLLGHFRGLYLIAAKQTIWQDLNIIRNA